MREDVWVHGCGFMVGMLVVVRCLLGKEWSWIGRLVNRSSVAKENSRSWIKINERELFFKMLHQI